MDNSFTEQFSQNIDFSYTSFDRVIMRGYIRQLFLPGGVVNLTRAQGYSNYSNGVLRIFTDQFNGHITKMAKRFSIPMEWWPSIDGGKNGAKLKYVEKQWLKKAPLGQSRILGIIADMETARTFTTKEIRTKSGKPFEKVFVVKKPVKHYYIYFIDELLGGPCYLKLSTYLPFPAEFYFNGHNAISSALSRRNILFGMKENVFTFCQNPEVLPEIASSITGRQILERINYWMDRFFRFSKGKYSTRSKYMRHDWYMSQVEVCSNILFKSAKFGGNLFSRLLDKFSRIGLPDCLSQVFITGQRPKGRSTSRSPKQTKSTRRLYKNLACFKHWFRGNSVKCYNKHGSILRVETTINKPASLRLKKKVFFFLSYFWQSIDINNRFMECFSDTVIKSVPDDSIDLHNNSIRSNNGKMIPAVDMRKSRQRSLLRELCRPLYAVSDFRTSDLYANLQADFRNSAEIRYELAKLRARGIVKKHKTKSLWTVTTFGWKWIWISICLIVEFKDPMISLCSKRVWKNKVARPDEIEDAYQLINRGINCYTRAFGIAA